MDDVASRDVAREVARPRRAKVVALTVVLAALWPLLWSVAYGSTDALLGVGTSGPSRVEIDREIPDLRHVDNVGHDGQQFYVIARHPFDPSAARGSLDVPVYRYRRILFPLLAGLAAPGGGRSLLVAFAAISMLGVALGAWSLAALDGAPRWLPVTMAFTPAVITSLSLSLSDALATGLALAGVLAVERRRWGGAVLALTLAALTRETLGLVALGLAFAPGMPRRWRLSVVVVPSLAFAAWSIWTARQLGAPLLGGSAEQLAFPFTGWLTRHTGVASLALGIVAGGLLAVAAWRARTRAPHIAMVLALELVLLISLSDLVAWDWMNSLRTAAPMLPLAIWALVRDHASAPEGSPAPPGPVADHPARSMA